MWRSQNRRLVVLAATFWVWGWASHALGQVNTPTFTFTPTPTNTPCAGCTFTFTPTNTVTNTSTATSTATATSTPTNTPTNSPSNTPTLTATSTPTATPSATATSTPTLTPSFTPSPSPTPTVTPLVTPTPTPPFSASDCSTIETYCYPNPVPGGTLNFLYVLCEASQVKVRVYNAAGGLVATYGTSGSTGPNVYPVDATVFSHGIYYYFVQTAGPSGTRKSKTTKFAVTRAP
ncbi:MAG TPA: T9SS type A sorting domain-containing protein [bacterium]|nr:T9SS type A sorting domain-containing protein [bacterium]